MFDELDEDIRAERARAAAARYGVLGAVLLVLVVGGVGGWKGWDWWRNREAQAVALPYSEAVRAADSLLAGPDPARLPAADAFARIAATAPAGYRTLAWLREAGLRWDAGDKTAALALWDKVSGDGEADLLLRDLGSLLWAQHSVDAGDPAAVSARTAKLEASGKSWRALALEVDAELAIRQDDKSRAATLLRVITADPLATDGLRGRAGELLNLLGAGPEARG